MFRRLYGIYCTYANLLREHKSRHRHLKAKCLCSNKYYIIGSEQNLAMAQFVDAFIRPLCDELGPGLYQFSP